MSVTYGSIGWNRQKRLYDLVVGAGVLLYLAAFVGVGKLIYRHGDAVHDDAMLLIRGLGTCGLLMLHVVLWIGPLCRLDRRFVPLLYNRRHLGVATFCIGLAHAAITIVQYHGFGNVNPLVSLLSGTGFASVTGFPFELLGILALAILFIMAATSHDFWLSVLSARAWKWLHMGVYVAYAALVLHVVLGVLQQERSAVLAGLLLGGVAITGVLHCAAALKELRRDAGRAPGADALVDVCAAGEIPENRAKVVSTPGGERIAVFRYQQGDTCVVSAVANVCAHQQGPLGEGKIAADGCITCPWHGYQYRPGDGCAPPPFHEKIATYRVTVRGERVMVDPRPLPAGTPVEPARCPTPSARAAGSSPDEFYTGYLPKAPPGVARVARLGVMVCLLLACVVGGVAAAFQNPPAPSAWPDERVTLTGTLLAEPYPVLLVKDAAAPGGVRSVLLVATGKFGLLRPADYCGPEHAASAALDRDRTQRGETIRAAAGSVVKVSGSILRRQGREMVEVEDGPEGFAALDGKNVGSGGASELQGVEPQPLETLGHVTLRGEVADPKCYFGAMKPGDGQTHKACATRCIAGGISPVLILKDAAGNWTFCLLSQHDGTPANARVAALAGEPVEIQGQLRRRGEILELQLDNDERGVSRL